MVPIDLERPHTYEDSSIVLPEDRERAFWQHDHVRLYGVDVSDRLAGAGFQVEVISPRAEFGCALVSRCRIGAGDVIWLCQ
jgi:hypothetical protein